MADITTDRLNKATRQADENFRNWKNDPHRSMLLEHQARQAAIWLGKPEDNWEEMIPLLKQIELGRLIGVYEWNSLPEQVASFTEYMKNR
jgi:hypothetical protein